MFKKLIAILLITITSFITIQNVSASTLQPLNVTITVLENYHSAHVLIENPNDVDLPFTITFQEGSTTITKNYTTSPIDAFGTKEFTQYNLQPYTHYDVTVNINDGELIHYDTFYTGEETPNTPELSDFTINEYHYSFGSSTFELFNNSDLVVPFVVNLYDDSNTLIKTSDYSLLPMQIDGMRVVGFNDLLDDMDYTMEINMDNDSYIQTYDFNRSNKDIIYPSYPSEINPYYDYYYKGYNDIEFSNLSYTDKISSPTFDVLYDWETPFVFFSFSFLDSSNNNITVGSIDMVSNFEAGSVGNYITDTYNNVTIKPYVYEVESGIYMINVREFLDVEYPNDSSITVQDIRDFTLQFDINLTSSYSNVSNYVSFLYYDIEDETYTDKHFKSEFSGSSYLPNAFRYLSSLTPLQNITSYGNAYPIPRYLEQIDSLEQLNLYGKNGMGYYVPLIINGNAVEGLTLTQESSYLTLKTPNTEGDGLKILMDYENNTPNTPIEDVTYGNFILDGNIGYTDFYIEILKVKQRPNAPTITYDADSFHEINYTITNNEYSGMDFDIIDLDTGDVLINQYLDYEGQTFTFTMERLSSDTTYNLGVKGYASTNMYHNNGTLLSTASVTTPPFEGLPITITENHDSFDYTIENDTNLFFDIEIITSYNHPIYGGISYNRIDDVNTQVNAYDTLEGSVEGLPFGENYNITINVYYPDSEDLIQTENYAITTPEPVHNNYTRFDINAGSMGIESTESNLFNPYNLDNAIIYMNGHLILDKGKLVPNNPFGFDSYLSDVFRYELATTNNASTYGDPNMVIQFWTSYTPFRSLLGEHGFNIGGYSLLYGEIMEQGDVLFIPDPVSNNLPAFNEITIFLGGYTSPSYVTEGNPTAPPGLAEIMANYGLFNVQGMLIMYFMIIFIINVALVIWKIPVIGLLLINAIVTGIFVAMNFLPFWASLSIISLIIMLFVMIIKGGVVSE